MSALAFVFSSGWASGLDCYLVVLVLGVADRVDDTEHRGHRGRAPGRGPAPPVLVRRGWRRWKGRDRLPRPGSA